MFSLGQTWFSSVEEAFSYINDTERQYNVKNSQPNELVKWVSVFDIAVAIWTNLERLNFYV